jgi:hypothetical protein
MMLFLLILYAVIAVIYGAYSFLCLLGAARGRWVEITPLGWLWLSVGAVFLGLIWPFVLVVFVLGVIVSAVRT